MHVYVCVYICLKFEQNDEAMITMTTATQMIAILLRRLRDSLCCEHLGVCGLSYRTP